MKTNRLYFDIPRHSGNFSWYLEELGIAYKAPHMYDDAGFVGEVTWGGEEIGIWWGRGGHNLYSVINISATRSFLFAISAINVVEGLE